MDSNPENAPVIIVGAGIAGLTAASMIHRAGVSVKVFEQSDGIGGRVRSDLHPDGYILDRGFQILLGGYPVLERHIDIDDLEPRTFERSVAIWRNGKLTKIDSPLRKPTALPYAVRFAGKNPGDKPRLAKLALKAALANWKSSTDATLARNADGTGLEFFQREGFSDEFIEVFARPFWGGITLDRSLGTNAGAILFSLKMLLKGPNFIPARGMQELPQILAASLPPDTISANTPVERLVVENDHLTGVDADNAIHQAHAVIVAADPRGAKMLTGIESIPTDGIGCTTVYLSSDRDPGIGKSLLLNAEDDHGVNHAVELSAVAPEYAPDGKYLMAAVILDHPRNETLPDEALAQRARVSVAKWLGHSIEDWEAIAIVRVPFSQFAQPPGFASKLPINRTQTVGLYLAGEYTYESSINGAMLSGETAAGAVLHDMGIETNSAQ